MGDRIVVRVCMADGQTMYRHVSSLGEAELCRAFSLDPVRTRFDLPRESTRGRTFEGVIFFAGQPAGRLWVAREGEQFRDLDPTSPSDFWNQPHTRM